MKEKTIEITEKDLKYLIKLAQRKRNHVLIALLDLYDRLDEKYNK